MCSTWQSMGAWGMLLLGLAAGLIAGLPGGWFAHAVRQWHRRTLLNLRFLGPLFKLAGGALIGLAIVCVFTYGYLMK